jgi:hypothetical protein
MVLTIDRSTWSFGKGHSQTFLLHDGKKDVLGFFAAACGATDEELEGRVMLYEETFTWSKDVTLTDGTLYYLAEMNDKPGLKNEDRELLIKEGFEKIGVQAKFVGNYPEDWFDAA